MWFGAKISIELVVLFNFVRNAKHAKTTAGNKVWRQRISQGVILIIVVKMAMRYFLHIMQLWVSTSLPLSRALHANKEINEI